MDNIIDKLEQLKITKEKVLYYSISFIWEDIIKIMGGIEDLKIFTKTDDSLEVFINSKYFNIIYSLKVGDTFIIYNDMIYVVNNEFHITTLYIGGRPHEKSEEFESQLNKNVKVSINEIGISNKFITIGVESIKYEDDTDVLYFGNFIKHITIALNKSGQRVFPKDSYTALSDGELYAPNQSLICGKTSKVIQ